VRKIRIYVEGGGNKDGKGAVRQGMARLLASLPSLADEHRPRVIACGSREDTFDSFQTARRSHPEALNLLLVDAELAVHGEPRSHLQEHEGWDLGEATRDTCHLMVQVMEAWLIADPETLAAFFGEGFRDNALPGGQDVEQVRKTDLMNGLRMATRDSRRGRYHKIQHGPKVLGRLDPRKVWDRAQHCDRLFRFLEGAITATD
jgi:hypothetical protein